MIPALLSDLFAMLDQFPEPHFVEMGSGNCAEYGQPPDVMPVAYLYLRGIDDGDDRLIFAVNGHTANDVARLLFNAVRAELLKRGVSATELPGEIPS